MIRIMTIFPFDFHCLIASFKLIKSETVSFLNGQRIRQRDKTRQSLREEATDKTINIFLWIFMIN